MLETFKDRLKYAREIKGVTQSEIAQLIGISNTVQISNWENGIRNPRLITAQKLAEVLGVRLEWLLHGTGKMEVGGKDIFNNAEPAKPFIYLRVIGSVSAGKFTTLIDESGEIETMLITRSVLPEADQDKPEEEIRKKYFMFTITGDSMFPSLQDGVNVVVKRLSDPMNQIKHGDVVIACTTDNITVVKRVKKTNGTYLLVSDNSEKHPGEIIITDETRPVGKVVAFYGKM